MIHKANTHAASLFLFFLSSIFQINAVETIALKSLKEHEESEAFFPEEHEVQMEQINAMPAIIAAPAQQSCLTRGRKALIIGALITTLGWGLAGILYSQIGASPSSDEPSSIQPAPAPKPSPALPACNLPPEVFTSTNSTLDPECLPDNEQIDLGTQRLLPYVMLTAPLWSQSVSVKGIHPIYISTHRPGVRIKDIKQALELPWWVGPHLYSCLALDVIFCFKEHTRVPLQNTSLFFEQNMRAFYQVPGLFKEGSLNAICEAAQGPCARNLTAHKASHNPLSTKLKLAHLRAHTKHNNRALNNSHALKRGNQGRKK